MLFEYFAFSFLACVLLAFLCLLGQAVAGCVMVQCLTSEAHVSFNKKTVTWADELGEELVVSTYFSARAGAKLIPVWETLAFQRSQSDFLDALSYRELQISLKSLGLKAAGSKLVLRERLLNEVIRSAAWKSCNEVVQAMSYRELQLSLKGFGAKARGCKVVLRERLVGVMMSERSSS